MCFFSCQKWETNVRWKVSCWGMMNILCFQSSDFFLKNEANSKFLKRLRKSTISTFSKQNLNIIKKVYICDFFYPDIIMYTTKKFLPMHLFFFFKIICPYLGYIHKNLTLASSHVLSIPGLIFKSTINN